VVDPHEVFRSGLVANLREDGHLVFDCPTVAMLPLGEGLDTIDALVIGYDRPADGLLDLARAFRRAHPATPVIFLTAQWSPASERSARRLGVILWKPVDYSELHAVIHRLVDSSVA
jgi:DNA-binding response OmpR family regulator